MKFRIAVPHINWNIVAPTCIFALLFLILIIVTAAKSNSTTVTSTEIKLPITKTVVCGPYIKPSSVFGVVSSITTSGSTVTIRWTDGYTLILPYTGTLGLMQGSKSFLALNGDNVLGFGANDDKNAPIFNDPSFNPCKTP